MHKSSINNLYRPEIDGLRAFAVISVIIYHFNKEILPKGYLGVDIFFVISGFVITSSIYQRPNKNFKDFISRFYARRIKRLVPALLFFALVTSFVICLFNPHPKESLETGFASLFGLSNLYLFKYSTNYFAQSTTLNVFTHTWSLSVEEQFYILFPLMIWFSGFGRQTKNGARNLLLIIGILAIASLLLFIYTYPINESAAYYLMPTRFWEIATGCLLFIVLQKRKSIEHFLEKVQPTFVFGSIVGIMYFPMPWATTSTITVVSLSALLIASLKKGTALYTFFTNPKIVYIGLISYSLYLWHWGVLSISHWTIGIYRWSVPFQIILMLSLAIFSYRYIETPFRNNNWFGKRWKTILFGIGGSIALSLNLVLLNNPLKGKLFIGSQFNKWNMQIFNDLKIINNINLPTIYLLGDSHADHYGEAMTDIAGKKEFNFIMHPQGKGLKLLNKSSEEYILAPLREYKKSFKKGDVIIFSAHRQKYNEDNQNWTKEYGTFIEQTQNIGIKFILISPTPIFPGVREGYMCQEEWFRPSWRISSLCFSKVSKSDWVASNNVVIWKIKRFLKANPEVLYIDAFSLLCQDSYCKNHDQLSLMYKDNNHLNSYGAMKLKKTIEDFISSN